jgi:hypothetical protein
VALALVGVVAGGASFVLPWVVVRGVGHGARCVSGIGNGDESRGACEMWGGCVCLYIGSGAVAMSVVCDF